MTLHKSLAIIFCFILAAMVLVPRARAGEWNQKTKMTFSEPIEVPGVALPAGTYWFVLLDDHGDRQIVRIFSSDWSEMFANLHTIPIERTQPTSSTEITFAERLHSDPEAVLDWYYPGLLLGQEFVYTIKEERELTRDAKQDLTLQPASVASNAAMPGA